MAARSVSDSARLLFGGLGQNVFNPALLGRAFLQAAFPVAITTWPAVASGNWWALRGPNLALPFMSMKVDAVTSATPLGLMKFEHTGTAVYDLFFGRVPGSVGETSALVILLCGGLPGVPALSGLAGPARRSSSPWPPLPACFTSSTRSFLPPGSCCSPGD